MAIWEQLWISMLSWWSGWRHATWRVPNLLPFGKPRASRHKVPVTWSSSVLFAVSLNTGWRNCRVACDLKGRGTHVTSHQHRYLFRLSDGVTEMPDEISRNLASLNMSMWKWNDTHAGVHPPYDRYVALKLKRYHGALLFWGNCLHRGCYIDNTVPSGTSKRPTDSSAHISNHNETGRFKDSQFLYTIVSKNINKLKLTAHLSL